MKGKSFDYADSLAFQIHAMRLPEPVREYLPFKDSTPPRKFRLDLAWPDRLLFCECDGGEWSHGRHGRGIGMASDCEKQNLLTLAGWRGFRFIGSQVRSGMAIAMLEQWFKAYP